MEESAHVLLHEMRPGKTKPDPKREEVLRRLFPWAAILLGVIWLVLYFLHQR